MEINTGNLPFSAAAERNQQPIIEALEAYLPEQGRVLEVGSGTGQHVVAFARQHTGLLWQPSDQPGALDAVRARVDQAGLDNLAEPVALDVTSDWPEATFEMIYSANTLHIMRWEAGRQFLITAGRKLRAEGVLAVYGPFIDTEIQTAASNLDFDRQLRGRDPAMGLRKLGEVKAVADSAGLRFTADHEMPANNRLLIWKKS